MGSAKEEGNESGQEKGGGQWRVEKMDFQNCDSTDFMGRFFPHCKYNIGHMHQVGL